MTEKRYIIGFHDISAIDMDTLRAHCELASTPDLANCMQLRVEASRELKGKIKGSLKRQHLKNRIDREIRMIEPILGDRQMSLFDRHVETIETWKRQKS